MTRIVSRSVFVVLAAMTFTSCDAIENLFGKKKKEPDPDLSLSLLGCLTAGGSLSTSQMPPAVPSVRPWLTGVSVAGIPDLAGLIDAQLTGIALTAAQQFNVRPTIRYFDEKGSPNAFATPVNTEGSTHGTVRIGVNLVASETRRFIATDYGRTRGYSYSVTAVIAHELAHILQFAQQAALPTRNTELQADYLAGWYFSYLSRVDPNFAPNAGLQDGMRAFFERGDYNFNNAGHHGTPQQRLAAFTEGYNARAANVQAAWAGAQQYRQLIGGAQ